MIFDTHAHYTARQFDGHRDALLDGLPGQGVCAVVDCATDGATARQSLALGRRWTWLYTAAGIHPESLIEEDASTQTQYGGDWRAELADIRALLDEPRVVAVGEIGLDYHWPIPKDAQMALFLAQLELAAEKDLPVLIHDREAHADMYAVLKERRPRGILHCYSGSADDALWLTQQGLYLGFGGTVTFKNARKTVEAAAACPLDKLVLETDCPYLAPEPLRGTENNSATIAYVARRIAEIKGLSEAEVLRVTEENARRLFGLPDGQKNLANSPGIG